MDKESKNIPKLIALALLAGIVLAIFNGGDIKSAGFTVLKVVVVIVIVIAVAAAAIVVLIILLSSNENKDKAVKNKGETAVDKSRSKELREAESIIKRAVLLEYKIKDSSVKEASVRCREKLSEALSEMKKQPEEIDKNRQLLSYYIPTYKSIITKFRTIESGIDVPDEAKNNTIESLNSIENIAVKIKEKLFKDEVLELDIEKKTLDVITERDNN